MRRWHFIAFIVVLLAGSLYLGKEKNIKVELQRVATEDGDGQDGELLGKSCVRVGNIGHLDFHESNTVYYTNNIVKNGNPFQKGIPFQYEIAGKSLNVTRREGNQILFEHTYGYEFENNVLTLSDLYRSPPYEFENNFFTPSEDDRLPIIQLVFLCNIESVYSLRNYPRFGPNTVDVDGTIEGPGGFLTSQRIGLYKCTIIFSDEECNLVDETITDENGYYLFSGVEPLIQHKLFFAFDFDNPARIGDTAVVVSDNINFVLSKYVRRIPQIHLEITASSNKFIVEAYEPGQVRTIDFIYPTSPPPTATPSPTPTN